MTDMQQKACCLYISPNTKNFTKKKYHVRQRLLLLLDETIPLSDVMDATSDKRDNEGLREKNRFM